MWELGVALCQSQFKAAESIKEAKAACSQVTVNAHGHLFLGNLRSQDHLLNASQESQDNQSHMVQEAKATCSKDISEVKAQRILQAESLQRGAWQHHAGPGGTSH